jgi:hypothetical protein
LFPVTLRSSSLKSRIPPDEWAAYEPKFDRCRRIKAKRDKIRRIMRKIINE